MPDKKRIINDLLRIEKELTQIIHNAITEEVLRDQPFDCDEFRDSLIYHMDEILDHTKAHAFREEK